MNHSSPNFSKRAKQDVNRAINAFLINSDINPMIVIKDSEACQSFKWMGISRELDWIIQQARRGYWPGTAARCKHFYFKAQNETAR
jgi:hypothetical protein